MGALTRAKDWSATTLGAPGQWPQSLRTTLSILLNSKFPMFLWWGPELICFYNDAYRPSLGQHGKHPSILGQPAQEAWPEIWAIIKPLIDQVLSGGDSTWSEDQLIPIFRNGKIEDVYWTFSYSPVNDESGKPAGVFVTCTETTQKVNTLKEIKEREDQLNFTINAAELATWDLNPVTNHFVGNQRLKEWFGISHTAEIELATALKRIVERDRQRVTDAIQQVLQPGSDGVYEIEYAVLNPITNTERRVLAKGKALFNESGIASRFSGTLQDITPQVISRRKIERAIEELREKEEKLNIVIDASELGTWELNLKTDVMNCSDRHLEICGFEKGDDPDHALLLTHLHPGDRAARDRAFEKSFETGILHYESRMIWKDGSIHWVEVNAKLFYDDDGQPLKLIGTIRDITGQKSFSRELERQVQERTKELGAKNKELEKMNTELQSFAYVSSHDLQEPLRKIQTFASLILEKEQSGLSDKGKNYFERMQAAARRMQTLIEDLLAYSRANTSEQKLQAVDLNELVAEVKNDLKESLAEKQAILEYGDLGKADIIPFQFKQLLFNLIGNSLKFSKSGTAPRVKLTSEIVQGDQSGIDGAIPGRSYRRIRVSDNGIGFEPQYKERIFELFQRLHGKEEYAGTGIGLAIVKKIVENHNGMITATGELNQGAQFDIYLPV